MTKSTNSNSPLQGLSVYSSVILVIDPSKQDKANAYVVNPKSKGMLNEYINRCGGQSKAIVVQTENKGFQLRILSAPDRHKDGYGGYSTLSTTQLCQVRKNIPELNRTVEFIVEINTEMLFNYLILKSTFQQGVCLESLGFMRDKTKLCMIQDTYVPNK